VFDRTVPRRIAPSCLLAVAIAAGLIASAPSERASGDSHIPPNVVFLFTDDQPHTMMGAMPATRGLIGARGVDFRRSYISYPICCPARATMLTGLHMHNHGVRGNGGTYGGWHRFRDGGAAGEPNALPVRLDDAGYYSVHVGKYMNGYSAIDGLHVPPGWDEWYGRIGGEVSVYNNYTLVEKGPSGIPAAVFYGDQESDYSTDVFASKALGFIERANGIGQPFFLSVSFSAPHHPFTPAARDLYTREYSPIGPRPGFNERYIGDKPRWFRKEAHRRMGPGARAQVNSFSRRRDETLAGVDSAVSSIVSSLEQQGLLDNTYIVFTSDNGIFRGEHRITGGKYLPHEPSSHVPMLIRGPGISPGSASDELVSNVDLAATVQELAGIPDPSLDGRSLLPFARNPALRTTRPILIEGDTGPGSGIGGGFDPDLLGAKSAVGKKRLRKAGLLRKKGVDNLDQEKLAGKSQARGDRAPAYRAIRTDRYLYVLYATGDVELYDMLRDPGQLQSRARDARYAPVRRWLFDRLVELARCDGAGCNAEIGSPPDPLRAKALRRKRARR
jgi:arylsulfatase A-like enzyme